MKKINFALFRYISTSLLFIWFASTPSHPADRVAEGFGCRRSVSPGLQRSPVPLFFLQLELPKPDASQLHHPLSPLSLFQEDGAQRGGWQTPLPPLTDGFGRPDSSPALFQPPAQDVDLMEGGWLWMGPYVFVLRKYGRVACPCSCVFSGTAFGCVCVAST